MDSTVRRFEAAPKHGKRPMRLALVLAGLVFLAACQGLPSAISGQSSTELAEALTEFRVVPTSRALINVPNALVVLERNLNGAIEQRITLPNTTSLAGENVILLRAQTSRTASPTRLVLSDVLTQFGGAPVPFSGISDTSLTATSDQYGDITYTTLRPGGDLLCVLAFRRTQIGGRALPAGASALDIMMRNCVSGGVDTALAPVGAGAFGLGSPLVRF
jgi:hypothetical protein